MPHEVIMPALGMAQDTGLIVAWHKSNGDRVEEGDVLFEVETDKSTMEVEATAAGFLSQVSAEAGQDVPVGEVIALLVESEADVSEVGAQKEVAPKAAQAEMSEVPLPDGHQVIMPTLGMAQDTGLLVNWLKTLGEVVAADDVLFEVETDKSTMEVDAGASGFLAAILAAPGENVPTGDVIAIITAEKPETTIERSLAHNSATVVEKPEPVEAAPAPLANAAEKTVAVQKPPTKPMVQGKILASPKAKRLALEKGFDLQRLRAQGVREPFHVKDLEALSRQPQNTRQFINMSAKSDAFMAFFDWLSTTQDHIELDEVLASFAAVICQDGTAVIEIWPTNSQYIVGSRRLSEVEATENATPSLIIRKHMAGEDESEGARRVSHAPQLHIALSHGQFDLALEYDDAFLSNAQAFTRLSTLRSAFESPLRQLL